MPHSVGTSALFFPGGLCISGKERISFRMHLHFVRGGLLVRELQSVAASSCCYYKDSRRSPHTPLYPVILAAYSWIYRVGRSRKSKYDTWRNQCESSEVLKSWLQTLVLTANWAPKEPVLLAALIRTIYNLRFRLTFKSLLAAQSIEARAWQEGHM